MTIMNNIEPEKRVGPVLNNKYANEQNGTSNVEFLPAPKIKLHKESQLKLPKTDEIVLTQQFAENESALLNYYDELEKQKEKMTNGRFNF